MKEKNHDTAHHQISDRSSRRRGAAVEIREPAGDPVPHAARASRAAAGAGLSRNRRGGDEPPPRTDAAAGAVEDRAGPSGLALFYFLGRTLAKAQSYSISSSLWAESRASGICAWAIASSLLSASTSK